jgi:chromosome segregation ATPase
VLKQNNTSQLKKISLLQDKLDSSAGALLTSKKECDRLTKEIYIIKNERDKATRELIAQNQIEYNKLTKELFICQTEKSELIEEIKIYIANEDIYKQNLEKRKIKIEKLQKKVEELTANQ